MCPVDSHTPPPGRITLDQGIWVPRSGVTVTASRSSGPGGQGVNKVSSRVQLRVPVTAIEGISEAARQRLREAAGRRLTASDELLLVSQESRSQHDNKQRCLERLRDMVRRCRRKPRTRRATKPTKGSVERRIKEKKKRGEQKKQRRGKWS